MADIIPGKICSWMAKLPLPLTRSEDIEDDMAELLARNNVVAQFSGQVEWGAHALGNQSIFAKPLE